MTWDDVLARIRAGEDERTEFKSWGRDLDKVACAVCAMANGVGGLVVLGVADDGRVTGVPDDPDTVADQLTSLLHTGLNAPATARLFRSAAPGPWVHWIEVSPWRGAAPLERSGRVYVRRGRSTVEPSDSELRDLYNKLGFILTEEQVVPGRGASDVDVGAFRSFLKALQLDVDGDPQPPLEADLLNRAVLADDAGVLRPTVYGLMCFGLDPQGARPLGNAKVVMSLYRGFDRGAPASHPAEATGTVDRQVALVETWMHALPGRETWDGTRRTTHPLVPARALREAIVNAVAHRDYAVVGSPTLVDVFTDRIEITSPGALPNHLSVDSVLAGGVTRSRNEGIANFLVVRGLMEKRGRGLPRIKAELRAAGAGEPRLVNDRESRFVRVVLPLPGA